MVKFINILLSTEYSSSINSSRRYESSSGYESTGSSSYLRRESGSRLESGKYETGGTQEIAYDSKYSSSSRVEGGSKLGLESSYESKYDTSSKLDSIASKYGIGSSDSTTVDRSSKYGVDNDNNNIAIEGMSTKIESTYESKKGASSSESTYAKKAISNGSVTEEFETVKSVSKSESQDGRPIFSKTLEGQNIERK